MIARPPEVSPAAPTRPAWGIAYARGCQFLGTEPVFLADRATFASCGHWFDTRTGAFLGVAPDIGTSNKRGRPVARAELARRNVELPGVSCDVRDEACALALDIDPTGTRVAYVVGSTLRVVELERDAPRALSLHDEPFSVGAGGVAFLDRTTLFAWNQSALFVLREGAKTRPPAALDLAPPPGFDAPRFREIEGGARVLTFNTFDQSSELAEFGLVGRFRRPEHTSRVASRSKGKRSRSATHWSPQVDVWVFATDASELAADTLDDFAGRARERYGGHRAKQLRAWEDDGERSVELVSFVRDGCDPNDTYTRVTRRGDVLYRVVVVVPDGTRPADVPFDAVVQGVLQSTPRGPTRVAVTPPPPTRGPC